MWFDERAGEDVACRIEEKACQKKISRKVGLADTSAQQTRSARSPARFQSVVVS